MRPAAIRPTVRDVMVLVAGTAIGLAAPAAAREFVVARALPGDGTQRARDVLMRAQVVSASLLSGWSAAVVALDLSRSGRPPARVGRRRARRGPGVAACYASLVGVVGHLLAVVAQRATRPGESPWFADPSEAVMVLFPVSFYGGMLVLGSWVGLALAGPRRSDPDWIERLALAVGSGWLALLLLAQLRGLL